MQGEFYRVFFLDSSRGSLRIRNLGKQAILMANEAFNMAYLIRMWQKLPQNSFNIMKYG